VRAGDNETNLFTVSALPQLHPQVLCTGDSLSHP
jgi:hypothetical protein